MNGTDDAAAPLRRLVRRKVRDDISRAPEINGLRAALHRAGYTASDADIEWAWTRVSEDFAAGWLVLEIFGGADQAVEPLLKHLEEESPAGPE